MATKRRHDEGDENRNTVVKRSKIPRTISSNDRPGKILKIHLKNFMCHSSLLVDFNKNINFIIGRNGSGKSAILTALIIVLGGRASTTNRSNSIKDFIKKGCSSTTIDIEISNIGPCPYKKDVFGDSITICRHLNASGQSHYKIKSDSGVVVSTKKNELLRIVSHLKIMVDNPLSILTQDTARTFLNSSDPKKRYIFFTKATSLDYIKASLQEIATKVNNCNEKIQKLKDEQEVANLKLVEIRKKLEQFKSIESLEQTKNKIETEIYWSNIIKFENEKSSIALQLEEKLREVEDMTKQIEDENLVKKSLEDKIVSIGKGLREKQSETQTFMDKYRHIKEKCKEQKESYQNKTDTLKKIKSNLARIKNSQNVILQEIEVKEKQLNMWQVFETEKEQQMKSLLDREKELNNLRIVTDMESQTYFGNNSKLQDDMERLNKKLNQTNGNIGQTTSVLKMLDNQSNNTLSLYGSHMSDLLELIKKAHAAGKFSELPKGPIGNYIKVNNKAWAGVIEKTLGVGFLKGFCVTNNKDGQTLVKLIKNHFPNAALPIRITSKFIHKLYDISKTKAVCDKHNGILNFFDTITVSDVVIANCLIDQHNIERVLLFESEDTAIQCMSVADYIPKNCRMAFLKDGTTYYPVPNYRTYYGESCTSHLLEINVKARKMQLKQELAEYQKEAAQLENSLKEIRVQHESCQKERARLDKQIKTYDNEIYQIKKKLQELKKEEKPTEGNVSLLKEEYEILTKKESDMKNSVSELEDELKSIKCCAEELSENLAKAKSSVQESENACIALQDKLNELERNSRANVKKATLERNISLANKQCEDINKQIRILEQKILHLKKDVDESTRPRNIRSVVQLNEQLQQIKSSIKSVTACALDPVRLQSDYDDKLIKFENNKKLIEVSQSTLLELTKSVNMRYKLFLKLRQGMTTQVQQYFAFMLQMRNYHGVINVNHEEQTLGIEIDTQTEKSKAISSQKSPKNKKNLRDLRTLSGGERSYSTVSFLVALWNCMNLPFYFLDEFDVFMDHMNRRVVMDVLIENANSNPHKQYVFLTPQDTSSITASDTLKIHKMADPKR